MKQIAFLRQLAKSVRDSGVVLLVGVSAQSYSAVVHAP